MHAVIKGTMALALAVGPLVANADDVVTYDYTGTVTSFNSPNPALDFNCPTACTSVGAPVTGTITINFAAAIPSQSGPGTSGDYSYVFNASSSGGGYTNLPTPEALVYTWTLQSDDLSLANNSPSYNGAINSVSGGLAYGIPYWGATDVEYMSGAQTPGGIKYFTTSNSINLYGGNLPLPFDSNGLPILGNAVSQSNNVTEAYGGNAYASIGYTINSLTRVQAPEIDPTSAVSGLTLLLGSILVLRGRRTTHGQTLPRPPL
jgi:hypothetical protein